MLEKREKREANLILTIKAPTLTQHLKPGSSVSVNGVCLTVEHLFKDAFKVSVIPETVSLTNFSTLHVSSLVNLEPSLTIDEKLDGHFVIGHVDGVGKVIAKEPLEGGIGLTIEFPQSIAKFLSLKGSVAINGVSLTIAKLEEQSFTICLVPYTQQNTNLGMVQSNDSINIEVDLIARYLDRLLEGKTGEIKYEWLKERNFI